MHAGKLIELATQLSFRAEQVIQKTPKEIINLEAFWNLSRARLDHWNRTLSMFKQDLTDSEHHHNSWAAIACVVEEILCSEFFVRVVSTTFIAKDVIDESRLNGPVARSVFLFHLEARMRALELIELGMLNEVPEAKTLNDLRRRLESWCDLLLAFYPASIAEEFAFDKNRHREFRRDIEEEGEDSRRNVVRLLQISISEHGRRLKNNPVANPSLNRQLAALFDFLETNPQQSPLSSTIANVNELTEEAERYIEDYLMVK